MKSSQFSPKSTRKVAPTVSGSSFSNILQPKYSNSPRQTAQAKMAAAVMTSPRQVAQSKKAAAVMTSGPKATVQMYWAAKKIHKVTTGGREWRYWNQGTGESIRRSGWYGRDKDGGWDGASTPFINGAPLNTSEAGVETLSRLEQPFAPIVSSPSTALVYEVDDSFTEIALGEGRAHSSRDRSVRTPLPSKLQIERFSELVTWCQNVDDLIAMFDTNEKDVTKWRNTLAGLSGAQIALGLLGAGLMIAAIVATGGLAAIPMTAVAIGIAVTSATVGVGVGAGRAVAERGLLNAQQEGGRQHGRAVLGGKELLKGAGAIGAKEGVTRGLMAATGVTAHVGAQAVGAAAGGGGALLSVGMGAHGVYKAAKVDVGAVWKQVDWSAALQNVTDAESFLERHSSGFNPGMLAMVKLRLEDTKGKISTISSKKKHKWS